MQSCFDMCSKDHLDYLGLVGEPCAQFRPTKFTCLVSFTLRGFSRPELDPSSNSSVMHHNRAEMSGIMRVFFCSFLNQAFITLSRMHYMLHQRHFYFGRPKRRKKVASKSFHKHFYGKVVIYCLSKT